MKATKNNQYYLEKELKKSILIHIQVIGFLGLLDEQIQKLPDSISTLRELHDRINKCANLLDGFVASIYTEKLLPSMDC